MEWLEFKPWSAEVTRKLSALGATHPERSGKVVPFRGSPRAPRQWASLMQDWPRDSLWGHWVDSGN